MSNRKIKWGEQEFTICLRDTAWKEIGGVYLFCVQSANHKWIALYIGQSENLATRLPSHDRWNEAVRLGATHIHARVVQDEGRRLALEKTLIARYKPTLNTQNI